MKKLILILTALLISCSPEPGVQWLKGSFRQTLDAARQQNKPILVDFYSDT